MTDPKEIKQEIRKLKKLKLQCRPGSKERLDLHRQIKDLKKQLVEVARSEPNKEKLIAEILSIEAGRKIIPTFETLGIDLHKYTIKELEIHLKKIKKGLPE